MIPGKSTNVAEWTCPDYPDRNSFRISHERSHPLWHRRSYSIRVSAVTCLRHLSIRTEKAYRDHIKQFILFHNKRHPNEMTEDEIRAYLTHLAVGGHVSASTQNVALARLLFLYRDVLKLQLDRIDEVERARLPTRLPVVFTREEVAAILHRLSGMPELVARLMYGSGLRLMECLRLRVKDIDFSYSQIWVRDGKGAKDRITIPPPS